MPVKKTKGEVLKRYLSLMTNAQYDFIAKKAIKEKKTKGSVIREIIDYYIISNK